MNRTRLADIKGKYQTYSTRSELADTLGVHPLTIRAWRKAGKIPEPEVQADNGWYLWSPEQVQRIIQLRTQRGGL